MNIKPTIKTPTSMGKNLEKKYSNALFAKNVNLNEVDKTLKDDKFTQKKKIWDLAKMEGLVRNDPKLNSIYEEMSNQGREKYGYHYNETIMNILFNEYVLNSPNYLEKYRNATPIDKRRSRKKDYDSRYHIELKQNIDKVIMDKKNENIEENTDMDCWDGYRKDGTKMKDGKEVNNCVKESEEEIDETTTASSSGSYSAKAGYKHDDTHNVYEEELDEHHLNTREDKVSFIQKHKPQEFTIDKLESMSDDEVDSKYKEIEKELGLDAYQNEGEDRDEMDETTTSASSGQYSTPHAFASTESKPRHSKKPIYSGGEMVQESYLVNSDFFQHIFESIGNYMNEENEDQMKDSILNYMIKDNPSDKQEIEAWVDSLEPESIKTIYSELGDNLNEKATSKAQQKLMGMVHAYKKGEMEDSDVSKQVKDIANNMSDKDAKDYASTKHDEIDEKDEIVGGLADEKKPSDFNKEQLLIGMGVEMEHTDDPKIALEIAMDHLMEIPDYYDHLIAMEKDVESNEGVEDIMKAQTSMTDDTEQSMADDMQNLGGGGAMLGEDGHCRKDEVPVEGVPVGQPGSCRKKTTKVNDKSKKDSDMNDDKQKQDKGGEANKFNLEYRQKRQKDKEKRLKDYQKKISKPVEENQDFMESYNKYMESLSEDRKSTSMLNLEKVKKQTKDLTNKELMKNLENTMHDIDLGTTHEDEQTQIDNPQKMSQDIEKEGLKKHKGEALKNVGNSTNAEGDEIPKRNATTEEEEQIALDRGYGMHDIDYDLDPDERFEERMKDDMGEDLYALRQKKKEYKSKAPMYNKDTEPVMDGDEKEQYNKYKNESVVTGKYRNDFNQNKFVDFMISECEVVEKLDEGFVPLSMDGMGNRYTQNVHESSMREDMDTFSFYLNKMTNKVVKKQSSNKGLMTESEDRKPKNNLINEEAMNKMRHLWDYNGKSFVDNKQTKKYRGF